jgi:hypothetical protein
VRGGVSSGREHKIKRAIWLFLVVPSIALCACAPKAIAPDAIAGTYRATVTAEALIAAGKSAVTAAPYDNTTYQVKFSPDGTLEMWRVNAVGLTPILQAQFTLTSKTLAMTNPTGSLGVRCLEEGDATYAWNLDGDRLKLTSIKDNCEWRRFDFDALTWSREQ